LASKKYPCDLVPDGKVVVSINAGHTGLGGASCGPITLEQYQMKLKKYSFGYSIRPYNRSIDNQVRKCIAKTELIP